MPTAVDICNKALAIIGSRARVTSISPVDGSAEAEHCARFYDLSVNSVLESHDWNFASTRAALVVDATHVAAEWDYAYEVPSDLLRARELLPEGGVADYPVMTPGVYDATQKVRHEYVLELNDLGDPRIYTDVEDAQLRYTRYITNTGLFSPLFIQAVSLHLAAALAGVVVKGDQGAALTERLERRYRAALAQATVSDSSQRFVKPTVLPNWLTDR